MHKHLGLRSVATASLVTLIIGTTATAQERRILTGHIPAEVANTVVVGRLPATSTLKLAIGLPLRNQAALTALLQQIYDPASPNYRHYLTSEQFTEQFGPTEADYQTVIAFAQAHRLAVTGTHPHRMLLDVAGSVADVESVFQTTLRTYQHLTEARSFYAPDTEPSVEANVPVADISGLSNFRVARPKHRKPVPLSRSAKAKPKAGSWPGGLFIGSDYRAAYAPGVALDGSGQSVGLVEFDGYYTNDIAQYESLAGLKSVPLQNVLLDGFNGSPGSQNSEVALDIEMVISMAPGLSNIVVFESWTNGLVNEMLSAMSTNTAIKQFGCSWDFASTPQPTMDGLFQKMAAQGQSFFNASGDSGAFTGSWPQPDDDPYITLVGGTTLATCAPGGAKLWETAWNAPDFAESTSGGFSTSYTIASSATWQQGISMAANVGSTTWRNIPDVAMVADAIFIVADNGQQEISGGTSVSAQLWAGFAALANQQAAASGQGPIGFVNPAIYALGKSLKYSCVFNDTIAGNNTNGIAGQFYSVPGYDLCTGWGTPTGGSLILALATPDGLVISPGTSLAANGPMGGPFTVTTDNLSLSNAGTAPLNWSLSNTSAWLNASSTSGTLAVGAAATPISISLNAAANRLAAGVYTANVVFSNKTTALVQTRQFTLLVGQDLVQDGGFEVGDFAYWNLIGVDAGNYSLVDDGSSTGITPYDGTYCAALGQVSGLAYLTQSLPTRAGQLYLLSFWWQSMDLLGFGTTPSQFLVMWNNTTLINDANLGVFDWTNMQFLVQAAGTNSVLEFGFRNDNSWFGLDDISMMPIPVPVFQSATVSGGTVRLTWTAMAGMTYQLQYKTNVTAANWANLGGPTNAAGTTISVSDPIGSNSRRFYRVALVP